MNKAPAFALSLVLLAALAPALSAKAPRPTRAQAASAQRGLAFAQARCSGCHGVTANSVSPNPESPPFEDIANRPGTTRETLHTFLRDSHNYPAAMNFTVDGARIRDLAEYLATLQKRGYHPGI